MSLSPINRRTILLAVCTGMCTILAGCVSGVGNERAQLTAPSQVSQIYSHANLQLKLAISPAGPECAEAECVQYSEFDHRVSQVGARLALAAYQVYPSLAERVPALEFSVADKTEPGTASTAGGQVVVLRPVSTLVTSDEALSFVIAREMGHIIGQHHEENTAFSMLTSVVTTILAPVAKVAKLLASFSSGVSAAGASAAVTAGSFAGSQMLIESYRPKQREEADDIAIALLKPLGYQPARVAAGFSQQELKAPGRWVRELHASVQRLAAQDAQPDAVLGLVAERRPPL